MVDDDNPPVGDLAPESEGADFGAPSAPNRSTSSPSTATDVNNVTDMSDDDLARALEKDFARVTHTGVLPVVNPFAQPLVPDVPNPVSYDPVAAEPLADEPDAPKTLPPESLPPESLAPESDAPESLAPESDEPEWQAPEWASSEPGVVHALDDVPLSGEYFQSTQSGPTVVDHNPWAAMNMEQEAAASAPSDAYPIFHEASAPQVQASEPPEPPTALTNEPPVRRSIPTSELAAALSQHDDAGETPVDFMAQLEDQLRLREQDVSEFLRWQESKVAEGSAEALAQVESVRVNFGDIIESAPSAPQTATATEAGPVLATHTFRIDEVLDSDLLSAPAPMTTPVSDIPPPADHVPGSFSLDGLVAPLPSMNAAPITPPPLSVPPISVPPISVPPSSVPPTPVPPSPVHEEPTEFAAREPEAERETGLEHPLEFEHAPELEPEAAPETGPEPEFDLEAHLGFARPASSPSPVPDLVEPPADPAAFDPFDFDVLIGGETAVADEVPTVFSFNDAVVPDRVTLVEPTPEPLIEPTPEPAHDSLRDDHASGTDHVFEGLIGAFPVTSEGVASIPAAPGAPFAPVPSSSAPISEGPTAEANLSAPPAFRVESTSTEPTPTDQRVGRASRLFWLWFAANSSIVSVAFGGAVLSLGMSLRQAIVATLIGVAVSFLPLGLGTLAGKWSGQPTMIVSRATFGHLGNILPSVLAIIVRVFWGAVLLWFLAAGTARIMVGAEMTGPLTEMQVMIIGLAVGFLLALVIAFFGYGLIARVQLVFTIFSAVLIVGLIVITWPAVNIPMALTVGDGPWILVITGAVLVFSFVGLVWAVSSADLARYQRASGSGAASMLWSTFGATIPAFVLISYGAVLAASDPKIAAGLLETPLDTIALLIPVWYPVPLIAALALSLLSGVVISIYSGGFALQATGASMRRPAAVVIVGAGVGVLAGVLAFTVGDFSLIIRDVATTLAVPIAAWAGIFGAEMMIRSRRFSPHALLHRRGVYADFHWVNVATLVVASVIGFGLTTASVAWLGWQGYLFSVLGVPLSSDLAASDLGVFVALIIGILTPIVVGIPGIRRQEGITVEQSQTVAS